MTLSLGYQSLYEYVNKLVLQLGIIIEKIDYYLTCKFLSLIMLNASSYGECQIYIKQVR